MSSGQSVTRWVRRLQMGDDSAAQRLWERYFDKLVVLARRRLGDTPRSIVDEEDIAICVFSALCAAGGRGQLQDLANRDELWRLLLTITKHKIVDHQRHRHRQKRGGDGVWDEWEFRQSDRLRSNATVEELEAPGPTPETLAILDENFRRLLGLLRNDALRRVAIWKLEGYLNEEIAEKLGVSTRAVERKLNLIRDQWAAELKR